MEEIIIKSTTLGKRLCASLRNSKVYPGADVGSDHQMLLASLELKLGRNLEKKVQSKADTTKLKDGKIRSNYNNKIEVWWYNQMEKNNTVATDNQKE